MVPLRPTSIDVPLAKQPSMGMAQHQLLLVIKEVFHPVVVISEVLHVSTKTRCSRHYMAHLSQQRNVAPNNNIGAPNNGTVAKKWVLLFAKCLPLYT